MLPHCDLSVNIKLILQRGRAAKYIKNVIRNCDRGGAQCEKETSKKATNRQRHKSPISGKFNRLLMIIRGQPDVEGCDKKNH